MYVHMTRKFIKRHARILYLILFSCCLIFIVHHQLDRKKFRLTESFDEVKSSLDQLFDPLISLTDLKTIWNKLMKIWQQILMKFLHDACRLCYENHFDCYKSINLTDYIYHINQTFYPFNQTKRPYGMGIYYYFDLKTFHSFNNSILPTDVTFCDYFHMIKLMIHVQLILHQSNIQYFLTKGTLIGTLRHHDVIPWDTDIDLFIPITSTNKFVKVFEQLNKSYKLDLVLYRFRNIYGLISYKIFSRQSPIVNGTNYRWPKIDLFPYQENSTHIYASPKHEHNLGTMKYINKKNI